MDSKIYCNRPDQCRHLIQENNLGGVRIDRFLCTKYTVILNTLHKEDKSILPSPICEGKFKCLPLQEYCRRKYQDCLLQLCRYGKCVYDTRGTSNITIHE